MNVSKMLPALSADALVEIVRACGVVFVRSGGACAVSYSDCRCLAMCRARLNVGGVHHSAGHSVVINRCVYLSVLYFKS